MCPHTCSRLREPEAKRLKYSERRNGFCARSSAVSESNHSSVVQALPRHHLINPVGSRKSEILGTAPAVGLRPEPAGRLGREEENLTVAQHLARPGFVEADQLANRSDRRSVAELLEVAVQVTLE